MKVILRQNAFGRWIVVKADDQEFAWSGSHWVHILGDVHIANFETRGAAVDFAEQFNFEVVVE